MSEVPQRIAELEDRIQELSDRAERCRQIDLAAMTAMILGALLLALMTVGVLRFAPILFIGGVAVALAGVVLYGSNRSTLEETVAAIEAHEALRTALIDGMSPRLVESGAKDLDPA